MISRIDPVTHYLKRLGLFASTLILAAVVTLPPVAAADDAKPNAAAPGAKAAASPERSRATFDLRIVGPGGKPIPGAPAEFSKYSKIQAAQIRCGTFLNRPRYGAKVKADDGGRIASPKATPDPLERLDIFITIPGFAPYWAGWDLKANSEPIPTELTAKGGVRVDRRWDRCRRRREADRQCSDYLRDRIHKAARATRGNGASATCGGPTIEESGLSRVPSSLDAVPVEINDPNFMTQRLTLSRALFSIAPGHSPLGKVVLKRGLIVTGKVTDELGKPIAKATVRTKFGNNVRTALTGADGVYRLEGCEPGHARIVVSAKGRARAIEQVEVAPKMQPVDFQMSPGGTLRIRVLDERGKPVPKATIFFQRWRGRIQYFEFDQVPRSTDDRG